MSNEEKMLIVQAASKGYDKGWEACAAIKADVERGDLITELYKEKAFRDLMIKELREALQDLLDESVLKSSIINNALAKSEHHNSRALEKMLLEAEIEYMRRAYTPEQHYARLEAINNRLAELNKE